MNPAMAFNLQNTNKQTREQSEACDQFAIRRDYEVRSNMGDRDHFARLCASRS